MYNGAGRAYTRDVRNTDTVAATAAASGRASSSELSESDNEAGFNRSSADYNIPGAVTLVNAKEHVHTLYTYMYMYIQP